MTGTQPGVNIAFFKENFFCGFKSQMPYDQRNKLKTATNTEPKKNLFCHTKLPELETP